MKLWHAFMGLLLLLTTGVASAFEFASIGENETILYDTPSYKGSKLFIVPKNMPVEIVLTYQTWSKVRDATGDMAWVESKALSKKRFVIVTVDKAKIYNAPETGGKVVFIANRHVLLEQMQPPESGWVKVSHQDGSGGFVRVENVWGE